MQRALASLAAGIVVGVVAAFFSPWQLVVLLGFAGAAIVFLVWVWTSISGLDAQQTRAVATREDDSRLAASVAIIGACVASLGGVLLGLVKSNHTTPTYEVLLTVSSVVAVVLAWVIVHTVFVLHYAHLYYRGDEPATGIDFNEPEYQPDYRDFTYFGFTIGMTFQVSDTNISSREIRRAVTRHAMISYLFGTAIVGFTINVMAGFIR